MRHGPCSCQLLEYWPSRAARLQTNAGTMIGLAIPSRLPILRSRCFNVAEWRTHVLMLVQRDRGCTSRRLFCDCASAGNRCQERSELTGPFQSIHRMRKSRISLCLAYDRIPCEVRAKELALVRRGMSITDSAPQHIHKRLRAVSPARELTPLCNTAS
jgi:hypothetical protein